MSISGKSKSYIWLCAGLGIVAMLYLPMLILGDNALLTVLDQLDGEVVGYMLSAKHLFGSAIPEIFQSGVSKTAFTPPSIINLLLYRIFPPKAAFMLNYWLVAVCAFLGMYLLSFETVGKKHIALLASVAFAVLPFYSVYGLSVMGQPLLAYAFISLYKGKKSAVFYYLLIAFFGLSSSLILVGYADLCCILLAAIILTLKKKSQAAKLWLGFVTLISVYIITNIRIITEMLSGAELSHKSEIVQKGIPPESALTEAKNLFLHGHYHAESNHEYILLLAVVAVILWAGIFIFKRKTDKKVILLLSLIFVSAFIALFYGAFRLEITATIRNSLGGALGSFQFDRFYWLYPCIWFLVFAISLSLIEEAFGSINIIKIASAVIAVIIGGSFLVNSVVGVNIKKAVNKSYTNENYVTWQEFYSPDLFAEIKEYIAKPCETYRVASIGLYPAVATYNGFYTIDGYSNNYSLGYKHKFRKIISAELEKEGSIKSYFDNWGNRCYLFCSEIPKKYQIKKDSGLAIQNLEIDVNAMRDLGCKYIFSALPVENCVELGLQFCKVFKNKQTPYEIYLYAV